MSKKDTHDTKAEDDARDEVDDDEDDARDDSVDEEEDQQGDSARKAKKAVAAKRRAGASDAGDEDEDEGEEDDDEEDGDEEDDDDEEARPASGSPVARPVARAVASRRATHEDEDGAVAATESEDPYWWTPHAVLGVLVLLGILGFFGVFNKTLGFLAPRPHGEATPTATTSAPAKSAAVRPIPPARSGEPATARETFGAKHLLVMHKGGRRAPANIERSKEEAKARAAEAMKKAKGGAKFEDLVKEYSDEPGAGSRGGDLGTFPKGAMVPEFQTALEKLKVGEISDLVETPFGYHVILRTK